jgi:hypothetical protein
MAHHTTMQRYTSGIFRITSKKIASHADFTQGVYASRLDRPSRLGEPFERRSAGALHEAHKTVARVAGAFLTPQITDLVAPGTSKPS